MSRFTPVYRVLGLIITLFSLAMLAPLAYSWWFADGAHAAFNDAFLISFLLGLLIWYLCRKAKRELQVRDGFLMVVLVWSIIPAISTLPLMMQLNLSFTDAYFECMSGLTGTGSTVISGLDTLPESINLWRHMLLWISGMGLIVLAVAVFPLLGIGGRAMFKAETPGPMKDAKLTPRITETAKGLWFVYFGASVACILAFRWGGMTWFDAVCHAFSTMGTGGFSTHDASFGYFNSPTLELIAVFFMLLACMNFATLYLACTERSLMAYVRDPEAGWFLAITLGSALMISIFLWANNVYPSEADALRHALFNVVSIATTTGFSSVDFAQWPIFAPIWMLFLCSFASCAGSTGSGIKMIRARLLYKQFYRELIRAMHPSATYNVRIGEQVMSQQTLFAVLSFGFVYMVSIVTLTLIQTFSGLDIISAFTATVASINNTGPGLGIVGPSNTYEVLTDFQTWVCSFSMLLGRLELFTLLVVLTPAFWRK